MVVTTHWFEISCFFTLSFVRLLWINMIGRANDIITFDPTCLLWIKHGRCINVVLLSYLHILSMNILDIIRIWLCTMMIRLLLFRLLNICMKIRCWTCNNALVTTHMPLSNNTWTKMSWYSSCVNILPRPMSVTSFCFFGIMTASNWKKSWSFKLSIITDRRFMILIIMKWLLFLT